MSRPILLIVVTLGACTFETRVPQTATEDAAVVVSCDAPTLSCASAKTLRASCAGSSDVDIDCPWGCLGTGAGPHCGAVIPSGGGANAADLEPTSLVDFMLAGTIDGSTGEINGNSAASMGVVYRQATGNIAVFRFKTLTVTGALKLEGTRAIALVSAGEVMINGVIDARGPCDAGAGRTAGAGGRNGGSEGNGQGTGNGFGDDTPNRGASGAGHGGVGGDGAGGVTGGTTANDPQITTLVGGAGGGGAKTTSAGGGGGGAIQIVSNKSIAFAASSGINAGGCGGTGGDGNSDAGGGGGGAGGTILLEAPRMTIAGTLAVNGGAGGNRIGGNGNAGTLDRMRAAAANGGGRGGAGNAFDGEAGVGAGINQTNAGGGGGVGRIRLNTGTGAATELVRTGGTLSPDLTDGALTTTTHERANTQ